MKIAVCVSNNGFKPESFLMKILGKERVKSSNQWAEKLGNSLEKNEIAYDIISIDEDNWINFVDGYDIIIWKPSFMGNRSSQIFKEKIYFIQYILKIRVYPNYETVWHFDSKVAQKYLFEYYDINSPSAFVSHNYQESLDKAKNTNYPVVLKTTNGAGSTGVKLLSSFRKMKRFINRIFIWNRIVGTRIAPNCFDRFGELYFQEFIPNNDSDLRINIYGSRYATGFWRNNRDNDFRASGSGKIDYNKVIPHEAIKYCFSISKRLNFDFMAYDIIYNRGDLVIIEISYGYNDKAVYNCEGYYKLDENGNIVEIVKGNIWPQELWVRWIMENESLLNE